MPRKIDDVYAFEKLVLRMNGVTPKVDVLEPVSTGMISRFLYLINESGEDVDISDDVWKYIAITAFKEGHVLLPEWMGKAVPFMKRIENRPDIRARLEKLLDSEKDASNDLERVALIKLGVLIRMGKDGS
ncbi:MAG: hypothetical protein SVK08_01920 [Halobacteriota archaeon]|nr:hypothetical protein [Halobacteriota archaeon]